MDELRGRVAMITGGASGIGLAMARRFAAEGMKLVLADIDQAALDAAVQELGSAGVPVVGVRADVSDAASMDALGGAAFAAWGRVHVLCNNAGIQRAARTWELTTAEWSWVLGVNLWGVIHGLRVFLPRMLAHGEPGHVVNTASMGALLPFPAMAAYSASKAAVLTLSEVLALELKDTAIGVSVLCPAFVQTRLHEADRNKPAGLDAALDAEQRQVRSAIGTVTESLVKSGKPPEVVAEAVVRAIRERSLYVTTHPEARSAVERRTNAILEAFQEPTGTASSG